MKIVAITGSVGCGKTTIAGIIRQLGYVVYDVDNWCRHLYYKADFLEKVAQEFPEAFEGGVFYKKKLRNLVFADRKRLARLEELTHPFLKAKFLQAIRRNARRDGLMFVDVAILFEMGWNKYCSNIMVADVPYEVQKLRVMQRDHISAEDFERINALQIKNEDKKCLADVVINTDCSRGILKVKLINLINEAM